MGNIIDEKLKLKSTFDNFNCIVEAIGELYINGRKDDLDSLKEIYNKINEDYENGIATIEEIENATNILLNEFDIIIEKTNDAYLR